MNNLGNFLHRFASEQNDGQLPKVMRHKRTILSNRVFILSANERRCFLLLLQLFDAKHSSQNKTPEFRSVDHYEFHVKNPFQAVVPFTAARCSVKAFPARFRAGTKTSPVWYILAAAASAAAERTDDQHHRHYDHHPAGRQYARNKQSQTEREQFFIFDASFFHHSILPPSQNLHVLFNEVWNLSACFLHYHTIHFFRSWHCFLKKNFRSNRPGTDRFMMFYRTSSARSPLSSPQLP